MMKTNAVSLSLFSNDSKTVVNRGCIVVQESFEFPIIKSLSILPILTLMAAVTLGMLWLPLSLAALEDTFVKQEHSWHTETNPQEIQRLLHQLYDKTKETLTKRPVTILVKEIPAHWSPFHSDPLQQKINRMVYDTLFLRIPGNVEPIPWLCREPAHHIPESHHITVSLRNSLTFSDGKPLTIDDVIFTITLHQWLKFPLTNRMIDEIRSLSKINETTLRIEYNNFPGLLLYELFTSLPIVPKHVWEITLFREWGKMVGNPISESQKTAIRERLAAYSPALNERIGSGPFLIKDFVPQKSITFVNNASFHHKNEALTIHQRSYQIGPFLGKLIWKGENVHENSFQSYANQQVDYWAAPSLSDVTKYPMISLTSNLNRSSNSTLYTMIFNFRKPLFQQKPNRTIFQTLFQQMMEELDPSNSQKSFETTPWDSDLPKPVIKQEDAPLFSWNLPQPEETHTGEKSNAHRVLASSTIRSNLFKAYLAKVFALLRKAQSPLTILVPENIPKPIQSLILRLQEYFTAEKITLTIVPINLTEIHTHTATKGFDLLCAGFTLPAYPFYVESLFHSKYSLPGGMNIGGFQDSLLDSKIADLMKATHIEELLQIFSQCYTLIEEEIPWVVLYEDPAFEWKNRFLTPWIEDYDGSNHYLTYLLLHLMTLEELEEEI